MNTIVLVDDELGIAEGIRFLLEKSGMDIHVIGIAGDGREGMKMILEKSPDLVICDVKMPIMDGLEMIQNLQDRNTAARFIMLSGYSEFAYAKQAMKLGVKNYICKPVEIDELYEVVRTVCQEVEQEKLAQHKLLHLEHVAEEYRRDYMELQLRRLLDGETGAAREMEVLRNKCEQGENRQHRCIVWEINSEKAMNQEEYAQLAEELKESLSMYSQVDVIRYSGIQAVLILTGSHSMGKEEVNQHMIAARQKLYQETDWLVSIGIGNACNCLEGLAESFQEAMDALHNKVVRGIGSIIFYEELEKQDGSRILIGEEEIQRLESYMANSDFAGCRQVIHQIFRVLREKEELTVSALQLQSLNIILSGLRTMPLMQFQLNEYLGKNILSLESIARFRNIEQLENWVVNTVASIIELKKKEKDGKNKDVIARVKEYIQDNFANEISLNEIAGKFYLNPYYLSQLFKKKTGMTYQSYVTQLRVEKAKALLMEGKKVYEVCLLVGYSDNTYFSKVFEKIVGCRPSEYRKKEMEE